MEQPAGEVSQELVVDEERLPEATEFVPVEEQPIPVEMPKPVYPEIARRAGVEGKVLVHILVDRMGRVRDVKIIRGPEVFHEAAKDAAWKGIWRPAIQNHGPVAVWVALPLRFTLRD